MRRIALTTAILVATSVTGGGFTASAANTPAPETITGTVQTLIREHPPGQQTDGPDIIKVLRVGTTVVPLTDGSLTTTKDGATVAVTLAPAADGTQRVVSSRTISAPVAAAISSVHQVYVALVRPKGLNLPSVTEAQARAMVTKVSGYWSSQTGSQVSFATAQVQSYSSAVACSATSYASMWAEAWGRMPNAKLAGSHLVVVVPAGAGCVYGIASIGAVGATDNRVLVSGLNQSALAHELGHNLGLYHSNSLRCGSVQDMPMVNKTFPGCKATEYDDLFDVMGVSGPTYGEGSLNAVHLDGMKLLPGAVRVITPTSSVITARITPLSTTLANRTLKISDPNGAYFVEYRTDSGPDSVADLNPRRPQWGVRVLRDDPAAPPSAGSYVLDATPTSGATDYNRVIPVGGTFNAASKKLTITVTAQDDSGATVSICGYACAAQSVVKALYQDLLVRPVDAGGLQGWSAMLAGGTSQAALVASLTRSSEYVQLRVRQAYLEVLGRSPSGGDLAAWTALILGGRIPVDDVQRRFFSSQEFVNMSGGTNPGFVANMYQSILGRPAGQAEVNSWVAQINAHGRAWVVDQIWFSTEAASARAGAYYDLFLKRTADPAGRAGWGRVLLTQGEGAVRIGIAGSLEYRLLALTRFP